MKPNRTKRTGVTARAGKGKDAGFHLVVAGCGGNIGSQLICLLARMPGIFRLTLVDFDRYEAKNLYSQDITPADLGQPKAKVQARRARRINPKLEVIAIVDRLENIPLGLLRGNILLACLDSKESRRVANEIAWRLGMPLIDAGVEASALLARVNVYMPGPDQPCLECAWGERDYADLATLHPCSPGIPKTPSTNAPASLGALTAGLQEIECRKLLAGQTADALIGRQVVMEMRTHKYFVTSFKRNLKCRFDHVTWTISPLKRDLRKIRLGKALELAGGPQGGEALAFGGQPLVKRLDCPGCGNSRRVFRLQRRLQRKDLICERCEREMLSAGFHMKTRISHADLGPGDASRSLASLGLKIGDVISAGPRDQQNFFELHSAPKSRAKAKKSNHWRKS